MKTLVLCGGAGTRLRPITHTSAEQLVPVADKPVLFHGLEAIAAAGVTETGIVVGDTAPEIRQAVGDDTRFGLRVTYLSRRAPLGLAHAVLIARDFLGDDDFVMYLGDNFIVGGIKGVTDDFRQERPDARILLTRVCESSAFGVAERDRAGRVMGLEEKPQQPRSDLAQVGVHLFTPAVHEAVRAVVPSRRGELEITDAIQWLVEQGRDVRATTIHGYWKDPGNVTDMSEVNRSVLETIDPRIDRSVDEAGEIIGRVRIGDGAKPFGGRVVGPAVSGAGTVIVDSYVGQFTSIAEDCRIEESEIEYSIVPRWATVVGTRRIEVSLIGHDVEVTPAPRTPAVWRLVPGDRSRAQVPS